MLPQVKQWYKPTDMKPPQGLEVLCMYKRDFYVAMRFKDYYLPSMFFGSIIFKYIGEPELWQEIDYPEGLTGQMCIAQIEGEQANDNLMSLDEFEKYNPEEYEIFVQEIVTNWINNGHHTNKDICQRQ